MSHTCVLLVALVGFEPRVERRLALLLDDCSALGARWRVTKEAADLWIVNGAGARGLGRGLVAVGDLQFRPAEMPHPVAFAEPLPESISTGHRFDPESMHSLNVLLAQLGRWLVPKLVQQTLVAELLANGASFTRSNVIEVQRHGQVLAFLDFEGDTAVGPNVAPPDVRGAHWVLRSRAESFIPPGFRVASTEQVLWQYAMRTDAAGVLPVRYGRLPIHLRRAPSLPARELGERHLRVVRELAYGPRSMEELAQLTGTTVQALRRDLGGLYLIGAITCDPGRSRSAREQRRADAMHTDPALSFIGARPTSLDGLTAPGFVQMQRPPPRKSTH